MSAPSSAANSIETATVLLQSELSRLEEQRMDLQNQLQSVQTTWRPFRAISNPSVEHWPR